MNLCFNPIKYELVEEVEVVITVDGAIMTEIKTIIRIELIKDEDNEGRYKSCQSQ